MPDRRSTTLPRPSPGARSAPSPTRAARASSFGTAAALALALALCAATGAPAPGGAVELLAPGGADALLLPPSAGEAPALPAVDPSVPSPASVLGRPLGTGFTRYSELRRYLATLAAASDRVSVADYGTTYEDRPLTLVTVTSPRNQGRIEQILAQRRELADPTRLSADERSRLLDQTPVVVWLNYGIHGNESSSSEAAMAVAYLLAAAGGEWERALDEVVVLIDPLSNPDGRERYVAAFEQRQGRRPDLEPTAAEHSEPWPGGRQNHYLIDLNRDWVWASQRETRFRLAAYRRWEPQVFVDLHEMSADATYFFPPTAEPINPEISPAVVRWLEVFGAANAEAFDRLGWLYYNAESFDLFYPGYGDSYPSFRGAVGMTYEVGGGGRAGAAVRHFDGTVTTLADRAWRHLLTSLATVETAAAHHRELLGDFLDARTQAAGRTPASFLWEPGQSEAAAMAAMLARHGLEVRRLTAPESFAVAPLAGGERVVRPFPAGSFALTTAQPLGNLARTLLEPETPLPEGYLDQQRQRVEERLEAEFFDVTAWSLPLAFNLEVWRLEGSPEPPGEPLPPFDPDPELELAPVADGRVEGRGEVGWLLPAQGVAGSRAAARLLVAGARARVALSDFTLGGDAYPAGTLFFPRLASPSGLEEQIEAAAVDAGVTLRRVATSDTEQGISLGSERFAPLTRPRVGLIGGPGASPTSFGFLWHLFDRQLELPITRLEGERLGDVDLRGFDVLVLPRGEWEDHVPADAAAALERWLRQGGVLVAVGDAVDWLRERKLTTVAERLSGSGEGGAPEGRGREVSTPGAILATRLQAGHPLAAGLAAPPPVLFEGATVLAPTGDPQVDVLTVDPDQPVLAGVAWPEARHRLAGALLVATERVDDGRLVLFAQDPAFRLFWRGTVPLLVNAVLYAPSWGTSGRY
jgi:hypothetical protein